VLVHGWGSDLERNWLDTGWMDALKGKRRLIAIDVRGHGRSDKPHDPEAYSYEAMSHDVLAVMDHLGIAKADLMGYSMGSFMGAWLLGHHADRFTSMILGGIGDETDESKSARTLIASALREPDPARITNPVGRLYRAYVDANPNNTDREALAVSALKMWPQGYPTTLGGEGLSRVTIPVLVVNGTNDHPYIDTMGAIVSAIPGVTVVRLEGKDHLGAVIDPRFKQAVIDFLDR
jgi:pimeloyl-ACP methyl ester carboxylesterase